VYYWAQKWTNLHIYAQVYIYMHNNIIATSNSTLSQGKENLQKKLWHHASLNPQNTISWQDSRKSKYRKKFSLKNENYSPSTLLGEELPFRKLQNTTFDTRSYIQKWTLLRFRFLFHFTTAELMVIEKTQLKTFRCVPIMDSNESLCVLQRLCVNVFPAKQILSKIQSPVRNCTGSIR